MGINVVMRGAGGDMLKAIYDTDKDDVVDVARLIVEQKALWNLSSFEYAQTLSVATQDTTPKSVFFKPDGSKMFVVGSANDSVYEYYLAVAWDVSTAVYSHLISVAAQDTTPHGVFFKADGLKMFVVGGANDSIYSYSLAVAWDVTTATPSFSFSVAAQDNSPKSVFFTPDGLKMFVVGDANDSVYEYYLAVAWDVSTAVYSHLISVAAQDNSPQGLFFKPDGSKMFVVGDANDSVYEYYLAVAWDVSTAVYSHLISVAAQDTTPRSVFFKADGSKMYAIGIENSSVYEYVISDDFMRKSIYDVFDDLKIGFYTKPTEITIDITDYNLFLDPTIYTTGVNPNYLLMCQYTIHNDDLSEDEKSYSKLVTTISAEIIGNGSTTTYCGYTINSADPGEVIEFGSQIPSDWAEKNVQDINANTGDTIRWWARAATAQPYFKNAKLIHTKVRGNEVIR